MTFPLTPAAPFTASVSTISATTANAWRTYIARSLDTVDGGAYANTTAISWSAGSAGWTFSGPLTVGATSVFVMTAGATVTLAADATVSSGGSLDFEGGSLCRFRGTAGGATLQVDDNAIVTCAGDVTWSATSTQTYAASSAQTHVLDSSDVYATGSILTVQSGAVATLNLGGVSAAGITFIGANGSAVWNGASTATWQTASVSNWNSGANFTVTSGAIANATFGGGGTAGTLAVGATGTFTVTAGAAVTMSVGGGGTAGSLTINANGTLTTSASSTTNLNGDTTITGKTTYSGTGAFRELRVLTLADPPVTPIDARGYDIIECITLTAPATIDLSAQGANEKTMVMFYKDASAAAELTITGNGGIDSLLVGGAGVAKAGMFYWRGTSWKTGPIRA